MIDAILTGEFISKAVLTGKIIITGKVNYQDR